MALVIPDAAEVNALATWLGATAVEVWELGLFVNDVTPTPATVMGDLAEAVGAGYAPLALAGLTWALVEGDPSQATYPTQTFTLTGALTIYGYFLRGQTTGALKAAERIPGGPVVIPAGGGTWPVVLAIAADAV